MTVISSSKSSGRKEATTMHGNIPRRAADSKARRFVHLNKNLCNIPMTRDSRQRGPVERDGEWLWVQLDDGSVRFRFAADSDPALHRYPTDADFEVLCQLTCRAKYLDSRQLDFKSITALLDWLGLNAEKPDSRSRNRVLDSLDYWATVAIVYQRWFVPKVARSHVPKHIDPPLQCSLSHGLHIAVSEQWMNLNYSGMNGFHVAVPLPLPRQAAVQNFMLMCKAFGDRNRAARDRDDDVPKIILRDQAKLAQRIGLNPKHIGTQLQAVAKRADEWLSHRGGGVEVLPRGEGKVGIRFGDTTPEPRHLPKSYRVLREELVRSRAQDDDEYRAPVVPGISR